MPSGRHAGKTYLLVEGKDDYTFFKILFEMISTTPLTIVDCGSESKIELNLKQITSKDDYEDISHIGIAVDVDNGTTVDAMRKIRGIFQRVAGINIPDGSTYPYFDKGSRKSLFGLAIPGDLSNGKMLEDLILNSCIPEAISAQAHSHVSNVLKLNVDGFIPRNPSKSRLISSLAVLTDYQSSLAFALQNGRLKLDDPRLDSLKRQLFDWIEFTPASDP